MYKLISKIYKFCKLVNHKYKENGKLNSHYKCCMAFICIAVFISAAFMLITLMTGTPILITIIALTIFFLMLLIYLDVLSMLNNKIAKFANYDIFLPLSAISLALSVVNPSMSTLAKISILLLVVLSIVLFSIFGEVFKKHHSYFIKIYSLAYSMLINIHDFCHKYKRYSVELVTLIIIFTSVFLNKFSKCGFSKQISFLISIMKYDPFWSFFSISVALATFYKAYHPNVKIVDSVGSNLDASPYYIYNHSSFGYTIGILGAYIPSLPLLFKLRLRYYMAFRKNFVPLYNTEKPNNTKAINGINKALNEKGSSFKKAADEAPYCNELVYNNNIHYEFIKLEPYSFTKPTSFYTQSFKDKLRWEYKNNKLIHYRFARNKRCVFYLIFMTPTGKHFIHRSYYDTKKDPLNVKGC